MSLLAQCAPSRWSDFLSIPDDTTSTVSGTNADLFVGKGTSITITLRNGLATQFRDIVVLGKLIIQSSDPQNTAVKPSLIARDFFAPGTLTINNLNVECRHFQQHKNVEAFREELQELVFLDWMSLQRESVNKIGLKSFLI